MVHSLVHTNHGQGRFKNGADDCASGNRRGEYHDPSPLPMPAIRNLSEVDPALVTKLYKGL